MSKTNVYRADLISYIRDVEHIDAEELIAAIVAQNLEGNATVERFIITEKAAGCDDIVAMVRYLCSVERTKKYHTK